MDPFEALKLDYDSTCAFIGKCDDHMFKVKNWALITTSAVIAFSISSGKSLIVFSNLILIPAFLYMELVYKSFQDRAIDHATELAERIDISFGQEKSHDQIDGYHFGFGRKLKYPSIRECAKIFINPTRRHIVNFYGLIVVFSMGAWILERYAG